MSGPARLRAVPAQACHITPTVELLFSRWTTPILWLLQSAGAQRFVELQRALEPITAKTLTERLRQLQRDGLVTRQYFAEVPPRVEYEITDLGRSLAPVFASLATWNDEHLPEVERARSRYTGPLPR